MFTTDGYADWHEALLEQIQEDQRRRLAVIKRMIDCGRYDFTEKDQRMLKELGIDPNG